MNEEIWAKVLCFLFSSHFSSNSFQLKSEEISDGEWDLGPHSLSVVIQGQSSVCNEETTFQR